VADTWSYGAERFNPVHAPAGSAAGGQFAASASGSGGAAAGKGTKATPSNQHPVGQGEHGKRVSDLQSRLNALGAKPPLKVDGIFGPKTLAAVKAFQKSHGLKVDGLVGPKTTASLRGKPPAAHHAPAHTATHATAHAKAKPAASHAAAGHKPSDKPGSITASQKDAIKQAVKDRKVPAPDAADATNPREMSALAESEAQALLKHLKSFPPRKTVKRDADPYGHEHYVARSRLLREQAGLVW
jgi:peptidoglycan hydrolase-like protein with peptidoglycan-binding domain